jgi:excisionase family DNA binding protein
MTTQETPPLLTAAETAHRLRVTTRTLQRMEADRVLVPVRIGRNVRYRTADVEAYIDSLTTERSA